MITRPSGFSRTRHLIALHSAPENLYERPPPHHKVVAAARRYRVSTGHVAISLPEGTRANCEPLRVGASEFRLLGEKFAFGSPKTAKGPASRQATPVSGIIGLGG